MCISISPLTPQRAAYTQILLFPKMFPISFKVSYRKAKRLYRLSLFSSHSAVSHMKKPHFAVFEWLTNSKSARCSQSDRIVTHLFFWNLDLVQVSECGNTTKQILPPGLLQVIIFFSPLLSSHLSTNLSERENKHMIPAKLVSTIAGRSPRKHTHVR